jgi:hypothetical protein
MNELDLLIALILVLGVVYGLMRGAGKQLIGLFSLWLSLIISLWLYKPLSDEIIGGVLAMSAFGRDTIAFVALMLFFSNLIGLIVRATATPPEEKKRKKVSDLEEVIEKGSQRFIFGPLNYLGGLVLGFVVTVIWLSLGLALLQFSLSAVPESALANTVRGSQLVGIFNNTLGYVFLSVKLFIPSRLPGIFATMLST